MTDQEMTVTGMIGGMGALMVAGMTALIYFAGNHERPTSPSPWTTAYDRIGRERGPSSLLWPGDE